MTTTTTPARDRRGVFAVTPPAVHAACLRLISAEKAARDSLVLRMPDEITYDEAKRLSAERREAKDEAERVILEHQGTSFLDGVYRVGGQLVGMRKRGKGGLRLVIITDKGERS